jgi:hypothetical protein
MILQTEIIATGTYESQKNMAIAIKALSITLASKDGRFNNECILETVY